MSFLGSVGTLMKGTGLENLLSEVYAESSAAHMVSGKAIARAIRAHFLVESSLMSLLLEIINESNSVNFGELALFYKQALYGNLNEEFFCELNSSALSKQISENVDRLKAELRENNQEHPNCGCCICTMSTLLKLSYLQREHQTGNYILRRCPKC